jgi:hypothetical protein
VSVDSEGNEVVEDCPEPEPPVGVPTADEAEQRVRELLTAIGVDPATVEFDTYADEWSPASRRTPPPTPAPRSTRGASASAPTVCCSGRAVRSPPRCRSVRTR